MINGNYLLMNGGNVDLRSTRSNFATMPGDVSGLTIIIPGATLLSYNVFLLPRRLLHILILQLYSQPRIY